MHNAQQRRLAREAIETVGRLSVAQDLLGALRGNAPHSVHGVDEGDFVVRGGVISLNVLFQTRIIRRVCRRSHIRVAKVWKGDSGAPFGCSPTNQSNARARFITVAEASFFS